MGDPDTLAMLNCSASSGFMSSRSTQSGLLCSTGFQTLVESTSEVGSIALVIECFEPEGDFMNSMSLARSALGLSGLILGLQANAADPMAYALLHDPNGVSTRSEIATLDLATGVLSNPVNITLSGHDEVVNGLTYFAGTSTYYADADGTVYSINTHTGVLTTIGSTGLSGGISTTASTTSGLFEGVIQPNSGTAVYKLDSATAHVNLIGNTGIVVTGNAIISNGLAGLYVINDEGSPATGRLYSINTQTGASTLIGNTGVSDFSGLIGVGGTAYSVSDPSGGGGQKIYTINLQTGQATFVQNVTPLVGGGGFWDLAPVVSSTAAVPEPSTLLLCVSGLISMAGAIIRRRN